MTRQSIARAYAAFRERLRKDTTFREETERLKRLATTSRQQRRRQEFEEAFRQTTQQFGGEVRSRRRKIARGLVKHARKAVAA